MSSAIFLWIFITIGFVGAISLTIAGIINLIICIKTKTFKHIRLSVQMCFFIANLMFFIYALGISLTNWINVDTWTGWTSVPTWVGNLIPMFLNGFLIIGKIIENKKHSIL
ncbi:MAG: hypothetical protein LBL60_02230 [Mycoplasmataceae bacterium]|jgi:uncharacterized protein with PQ loop repeat|nr:hypothetical protein [Mycoplasmataceae bacterium]